MSPISVRQATLDDISIVSEILAEAAAWLDRQNMSLWQPEHIALSVIRQEIELGLFYIAFCEGVAAGVVQFQTEDLEFWPDVIQADSAFLHRLAVRRSFAGGAISTQIFQWAIEHSRELGKHFLRLDCVADRPRLRSIYEHFGFKHHSDRQVGDYFVARYEYEISDRLDRDC
ncbi:GNAT family N-acetyltransferase [Chamaesiphon sp. VAR_69_metabat_338]|uniref:GNAT family N-acetyltransferase n=1 Tax=Chamaesiphon sp. VAR_69_metabat_338 TaxID=2964704 RepID=UPI00286E2BA3|nr:GNAT family N-acetyltransferase [Chamaesiphon sp. VAR_69_metabat_338]